MAASSLQLIAAILFTMATVAGAQPAAQTSATVVFVPYDKVGGPKLGPDKSVLLPYAEFLKLRATAVGKPEHPDFRPLASLAQAVYQGELHDDVATFNAELVVEAIARPTDHLEVRLPFGGVSGVAIESAAIEGPNASLATMDDTQGFRLFLTGAGRRTLRLKLATKVLSDGPKRWFDFQVPRAAAASLTLKVPDQVVLESPPSWQVLPATVEPAPGGGSLIKASAGASDRALMMWRPKAQATGAAAQARVAVDEQVRLTVTARGAQAQVTIAAKLLAGQTASLPIQIPAGVRLLGVSGPFVKDWSAPDAQGRVNVSLVREISQPFDLSLTVQLDTAATSAAAERLAVPEFRVPGAVQETGSIVIVPDPTLSLWPEQTDGLEAVSAAEAEGAAARKFQFSQPGWKLALTRKPTPARIRAAGVVLYEVTDELVRLKATQNLTIGGRGIFSVTLVGPDGYELREAGPPTLVSGFRQQGRRVEVNFRGEQQKSCALELTYQHPGTTTGAKLTLEPVIVEGADDNAGSLVLAMPVALKATEQGATGLEATDTRTLIGALRPLLSADIQPVLGYKYFSPTAKAQALIERQRTRLTAETSLMATITPSLMRIDAGIDYNVEFSATDTFQVLVPASAGEDVRFSGADIKEKARAAIRAEILPADTPTTWTVKLQRRVLGPYRLGVSFDVTLPAAESGKPLLVDIPRVKAAGVARETGFLAVSRGENIEIKVDQSDGLEVRDVKELPGALAGAFLGFRYYDPDRRSLKLSLVRHELEEVLEALIRRMHIETVLNEDRKAVHEVIFEIQNNNRQYLELALPKGMKIWEAFVRGVNVRSTTRAADGASLIELTKSESMDSAFRVRLVLHQELEGGTMGGAGSLHFEPPRPLDIPVLRTTWKLYLPRGFRYVDFGGTMRPEIDANRPWIEPAAEKLLGDLPARVAGGVARPLLNPGETKVAAAYNAEPTEAEKKAQANGTAIDVPIVREGVPFEFSKLSGTGTIDVRFWKQKALIILQLVLGAAAFAAVLALGLRRRTRGLWMGLGVTVALFILASLTAGLWGRLFATAFAAAFGGLVIAFGVFESGRLRRIFQSAAIPDPASETNKE